MCLIGSVRRAMESRGGDLDRSPSLGRRQRRIVRSRRQTDEFLLPRQSTSVAGYSPATHAVPPSGQYYQHHQSALRSQSQPPSTTANSSPACDRRGVVVGDLLQANTESTTHVAAESPPRTVITSSSSSATSTSSFQRLRASPRSGSSSSLTTTPRPVGAASLSPRLRSVTAANSDSHLSRPFATATVDSMEGSGRGEETEDGDTVTTTVVMSEFPLLPTPSGERTAAAGSCLLRRPTPQTTPVVFLSAAGVDSSEIQATELSPPAPASPIVLRLRQEESGTADGSLAVNSAANQEPESDHDFFQSECDRPPFHSADQACRTLQKLNELRKQRLLCDVTLKAGNVEVPAHKNVLAASSPYFYAMFTSAMAERCAPVVNIGNVDGAALAQLVDFIYTAEVVVTEETVQTLLPAANLLQLSSVREACCEFLQCQLHPSNCLGIQRFADMHDCSELLLYSRRFTEQHFGEVLEQGEEFINLSKDQLIQLISNDHIRVAEEQVFEAVLRWIRHRPETRQADAAEVCSHVRFALLPRDYLVRLSQSDAFLFQNPWCKDYLLEAMGYHLLPWEHKRRVTSERMKPRTPVGLPKTLIVLGGQAPKAIRSVEWYDFRTDSWTSAAAVGSSNSPAGTVAAPTGSGQVRPPKAPNATPPSPNRTRSLPGPSVPAPTPMIADLPSRRCRCGVAVVGGLIYVIGGFNGALRVRSVDIYDPVRKAWRFGPNMEYRRSTLGVAVLDGIIYAVGGFDGTKGFSSVEAFDPWVGSWRCVASMAVCRSSVGVGVLNGKLYAVGGYDGTARRCLASVECYDPSADKWSPVADMNHRRSGPAVAEMDGRLYAVGGHDGLLVRNSVEYYEPEAGIWCSVADMHFRRRNAGLVAHNGLLYVVGGDDGSSNLASMETYDPHVNMWSLLQSQMYTGRCYAAVTVYDWNIV
ncbi:distal tubule morphoproteinsis [Sparganum proliferum]